MTRKTNSSFIDTDIIQKIGGYRGEKLLSKILCSFDYNLYIHEYLLQEELILGGSALEQLHDMISANKITVMKISDLTENELEEYNSAAQLLANEMGVGLEKKRDRNAGEVKSMAMAFSKGFEYFISDDRGARVASNKHLQKLDGSCLETIRIKDVILHIRENEKFMKIDRKTAKRLYLYGANPKLARNSFEKERIEAIRESLRKEFDQKLWTVE